MVNFKSDSSLSYISSLVIEKCKIFARGSVDTYNILQHRNKLDFINLILIILEKKISLYHNKIMIHQSYI